MSLVSSPLVTAVMGVYNGAEMLAETIDSVLSQSLPELEFIIVNDGSNDMSVNDILLDYQSRDSRIRILSRANTGLTLALREGCTLARGRYIARIDNGDQMMHQRLAMQAELLNQYPDCHLVTSRVEFCGPGWEPLWITPGVPEAERPQSVIDCTPAKGLKGDIPHHGSVMFRTSAYRQVGGYRPQFYYGQDWDLWYRLAEIGQFHAINQVLYRARYFPGAISMTNSQRQRAIAACSLAAHCARKRGEDEGGFLTRAAAIRPGVGEGCVITDGHYFVGEALRRAGYPDCRRYFLASLRNRPLALRSYIRLVQSLAIK